MKFKLIIAICIGLFIQLNGQQIQKNTFNNILLTNAEVYTISNGIIKASVLIQDGIITQIGTNIVATDNVSILDCSGKRIYPGFIDSGTRLGLAEVSSVSLTKDYAEHGEFTPHMKALTAVNPSSVSIPVTRTNGITTVITKPASGIFPGTAALIDLVGYTPDQMYAGVELLYMNFPSSTSRGRRDKRTDEEKTEEKKKALKKTTDVFDQAKIYADMETIRKEKNLSATDYNPQLDALVEVMKGEQAIMIEVSKKEDILSAIELVNKYNLKAVFSGMSEGYRVTDSLLKYNIPVITGPMMSMPSRSSDHYDSAYSNIGKMHKAGIKVAIRTNQEENVRNLPFEAGFAATYGMGTEAALRAITLSAAEILGVDDKYGSIDVGKVANLFVCDGDPFEMKTRISHLFIRGWQVPMESRHTLLNDEFLDRSPGLKTK